MNGMSYVGQTRRTFRKRYPGGKWWDVTDNIYLKCAAKKYGIDAFEIEILLDNVSGPRELDFWEQEFIKELRTLYPKGYNMTEGGSDLRNARVLPISGDRISKTKNGNKTFFLLNNLTREIHSFTHLTEFSKLHDLNVSKVHGVLHGNRHMTGVVWTLPDKPLKRHRFKDPNGNVHEVLEGSLKPFCKKMNIHSTDLFRVLRGKKQHTRNWSLAT